MALTIEEICAPCCEGYAGPDLSTFMRNAQFLLCTIAEAGGVAENVNVSAFGGTAVTLGQKLMAASMPVVIASDQSAISVTFSGTNDVNILEVAGVAVAAGAGATTAGTIRTVTASDSPDVASLASIDTKTPALGQALAAASVPVVLTVAQITTLTPPAAITGFATEVTVSAIDAKLPATLGQKAMAASLAVVLASDQSSIPVAATLAAETTKVIGTINIAAAQTLATVTTVGTLTGTTSLTPGTAAANLGKAEGAAAASGDTGVFMLAVRRDALTASGANAGYSEVATTQYGSVQTKSEQILKATYSASFGVATAVTHQDVAIIVGSGTKTVTVTRIEVTGIQTTSGIVQVYLDLRSTDNSGGTSTTPAKIPHDSTSAAATAVVRQYTANPTLGTSVGFIRRLHQAWTAAASAANISTTIWPFGDLEQPIILRGTSQCLAVNLNGVTVTGGACVGTITWTEE